jgi:hypothetical protein
MKLKWTEVNEFNTRNELNLFFMNERWYSFNSKIVHRIFWVKFFKAFYVEIIVNKKQNKIVLI